MVSQGLSQTVYLLNNNLKLLLKNLHLSFWMMAIGLMASPWWWPKLLTMCFCNSHSIQNPTERPVARKGLYYDHSNIWLSRPWIKFHSFFFKSYGMIDWAWITSMCRSYQILFKNVPFPQTQTSGLISKARYNFLWFWVGVTVGRPRHEQLTVLITFVWATEERGLCILSRVLSI